MATLTDINGIGPALAKRLAAKGFSTVAAVAAATPAALAEVQGLSAATAAVIIDAARSDGGADDAGPQAVAPAGPGTGGTGGEAELRAEVVELQLRLAKLEKTVAKMAKSDKSDKSDKNQKSKQRKKKKKK